MKKIIKTALVVLTLFTAGCMNLYVRCPGTDKKIEKTYQCTQETFDLSYVIMFPQILPLNADKGLMPANIITVPIGCLCFVDVACEAVLDTVFWPIDRIISDSRTKSNNGNGF